MRVCVRVFYINVRFNRFGYANGRCHRYANEYGFFPKVKIGLSKKAPSGREPALRSAMTEGECVCLSLM